MMGASTSAFVPMAGKQSGSLEGLVGSTEHEMIIHGYEVLVNGLDVFCNPFSTSVVSVSG